MNKRIFDWLNFTALRVSLVVADKISRFRHQPHRYALYWQTVVFFRQIVCEVGLHEQNRSRRVINERGPINFASYVRRWWKKKYATKAFQRGRLYFASEFIKKAARQRSLLCAYYFASFHPHALCRREPAPRAHRIHRELGGRQVKLFVISFFMQGIFTFII